MHTVRELPRAQALATLHLPRYGEIPGIGLYMDQLLGYLDECLAPFRFEGDRPVTSSMVNNYVKQGLLESTSSKRYSRDHVAYLIVICTLKQVLPIAEIDTLIRAQVAGFQTDVAYDYFCEALETALAAVFSGGNDHVPALLPDEGWANFERNLVVASTSALAQRLYIRLAAQVAAAGLDRIVEELAGSGEPSLR